MAGLTGADRGRQPDIGITTSTTLPWRAPLQRLLLALAQPLQAQTAAALNRLPAWDAQETMSGLVFG